MKVMVCTPRFIWEHQFEAAYKWKETGEGAMLRERNRTWVIFEEWGVTMVTLSLRHHMERNHGNVVTQTHGVDIRGWGS